MAEKLTKNIKELEKVVEALAESSNDLDKAFTLYKKGVTLAKDCYQGLEKIELEVKELVGEGELKDFE